MNNYFVNIGEETYPLTAQDVQDINSVSLGAGQLHILQNNQAFHVEVLATDFNKKTLSLSVNGTKHVLKIEDEYDQLVKKMGLSVGAAQKLKNVKAPMPGLLLDILVETGQTIEKGTPLLILEAMKMENVLKSEGEGVVKSIEVTKGAAVDKGQVLIEME